MNFGEIELSRPTSRQVERQQERYRQQLSTDAARYLDRRQVQHVLHRQETQKAIETASFDAMALSDLHHNLSGIVGGDPGLAALLMPLLNTVQQSTCLRLSSLLNDGF